MTWQHQLSDVIQELSANPGADVMDRLENLLATLQGMQLSLAELKH